MTLALVGSITSHGAPAGSPTPTTPTTPEEVSARVKQLRAHYQPYLRSLPKPFAVRTRVELSGAWRWRFEVEDFVGGPRPAAPDWHRPDFDDSDWEETAVPEWRYDRPEPSGAPADAKAHRPDSRILWYRRTFPATRPGSAERVFLAFEGVAWEAEVWLNGTRLGAHVGYWEPFRFEVTGLLRERNLLAVRVLAGPRLGEPTDGWSVFPMALAAEPRYVRDASRSVVGHRGPFGFKGNCLSSGAGIHREVLLETAGRIVLGDVFVRADPAAGEARIRWETDAAEAKSLTFAIRILPENFAGRAFEAVVEREVRPGADRHSATVPMPDARPWQPSDPCLYRCRITARDGPAAVDSKDVLFGCRSFRIVTAGAPAGNLSEGTFLLNGEPVYLRGAVQSAALNAFWYWRQEDKLLDAVLLLKAGHFNAIRATAQLQFPEVRELLDRLGMMSIQETSLSNEQRDSVPIGHLARLCGRQARLSYNNPGVIQLAAAQETHFDPTEVVAEILAEDPERIVKPISGNMLDWSYGLPPGYPTLRQDCWDRVVDDFHCYSGWYRRGGSLEGLSRIYPPGRMVTCSEFGAEALDSYATMRRYPPQLQPPPLAGTALWGHAHVKKGDPKMTVGLRGRSPATLGQYIEASQAYQADVLAEQATGMRLSPRRIGGYFVFHFVEALPAWWPKSIVSFDLSPKPGYFALAQVNQPVVPLFQIVDQGRTLALWVANDRSCALPGGTVAWRVEADRKPLLHGENQADVAPLDATPVATVDLSPILEKAPVVTVSLALNDAAGKLVSRYRREVYLKAWQPPPKIEEQPPAKALVPKLPDAAAAGDPAKVDWSKAAPLAGWQQVEGLPTGHTLEARIAHDHRYLYVKLVETGIAVELTSDPGIWTGEDWEMFFAAEPARPYRQIGVNPEGAYQQVTQLKQPNGAPLPLCGLKVVSEVAKDRWTVLVAVPLETLVPGGLKSGSVFYGNFYRQTGGVDVYRELLAWSPNYKAEFHMPERFGELKLE